jgi:hypothetical protein
VPPQAAAIIAGVHRTAPNNTGALLLALQPLVAIGLRPVEADVIGMGRFPIAGYAAWQDDWLAPRFGADGSFHFHQGNDLVADCGLPIRSPSDGILTEEADPGGGYTVVVTQPDHTYFYLAHLSAYVLGVTEDQHVRTGDVIGFVGRSGDATGCHVHFEIHPLGGSAVDPKPYVDAWVEDALADAPGLIDGIRRLRGLAVASAPPTVRTTVPSTTTTTAPGPSRDDLLWIATANPAGGPLALAQTDAAAAVRAAGAGRLADDAQARYLEWEGNQLAAAALIMPTTPPALRPLLGVELE